MKALISAIIGSILCISACGVAAQAKPEDVIKFRKGAYQVIGWHNATLARMIKGEMPFDAAEFARNAEIIAVMSNVVPNAFVAGSDKGETRAKPEIWSDAANFKKAVDSFRAEATKLAQVSKTATTLDQVRSQYAATTKTCGACHDNFRNK